VETFHVRLGISAVAVTATKNSLSNFKNYTTFMRIL